MRPENKVELWSLLRRVDAGLPDKSDEELLAVQAEAAEQMPGGRDDRIAMWRIKSLIDAEVQRRGL